MKKLVLVIFCLVPILSFASDLSTAQAIDSFQELCAKENDPVKRANYCQVLDEYSSSQIDIAERYQGVAVVTA
jgi:hypothetical protein